MDKDPSLIPPGIYCYEGKKMCPYWDKREDKIKQESGYCHFLGYGDWEREGLSLLWDQVKECGVNMDDDFYSPEANDK